MRREFNNVVSVGYTALRIALLKLICGKRVDSSIIERISPNVVIEINKGGRLTLGKSIRIHSDCKLKVRKNAILTIHDNVKMNYGCMIFCHKEVSIGEGCEFGPNVFIYDHDHDFRAKGGLKEEKYKESPVRIGNNCWIGAGTIILKGTIIEDNCVIGAGSVVKGCIPNNIIFLQQRENKMIMYHEK